MLEVIAALLLSGGDIVEENYKDQIETLQRSSEYSSLAKGKLAVLYYKDQNHEQAFRTFLQALDESSPSPSHLEESALYEEALKLYLEHGVASAQVTASKILQQFDPALSEGDPHLRYIIAGAYANLGRFDQFFDHFYTAYQEVPDHYMAYKTRAILHIKLLERVRTQEQRERQREQVLQNVAMAIERYPNDHSLYKVMIAYAGEGEKSQQVRTCLNKIIEQNIMIPRSEIAFYVQQCVHTDQKDLGRRFIAKVKEWYQYSRAIEAAEKLL